MSEVATEMCFEVSVDRSGGGSSIRDEIAARVADRAQVPGSVDAADILMALRNEISSCVEDSVAAQNVGDEIAARVRERAVLNIEEAGSAQNLRDEIATRVGCRARSGAGHVAEAGSGSSAPVIMGEHTGTQKAEVLEPQRLAIAACVKESMLAEEAAAAEMVRHEIAAHIAHRVALLGSGVVGSIRNEISVHIADRASHNAERMSESSTLIAGTKSNTDEAEILHGMRAQAQACVHEVHARVGGRARKRMNITEESALSDPEGMKNNAPGDQETWSWRAATSDIQKGIL